MLDRISLRLRRHYSVAFHNARVIKFHRDGYRIGPFNLETHSFMSWEVFMHYFFSNILLSIFSDLIFYSPIHGTYLVLMVDYLD